jgi:hypothetical protein
MDKIASAGVTILIPSGAVVCTTLKASQFQPATDFTFRILLDGEAHRPFSVINLVIFMTSLIGEVFGIQGVGDGSQEEGLGICKRLNFVQ